MSLVINHNLMAMNAARNLGSVFSELSSSTQRLSSGLRINSAADDAAGLAIRELMRADIAVLNQGIRNASDAISMIQTAEGAMQVVDEKLIRMKELAEQAATGTYTTAQREIMNSEFQAMAAEIDRIANATDFNGVKLLDGSLNDQHSGSGLKVHFGTGNDAAEDYYFLNIGDMRATYESGLRVGNSDDRDTIRTTFLNAESSGAALEDAAATSDGVLALRFSSDFDSEDPSSANWTIYGYVDIDASQDSIDSIVAEINGGRQASGTFTFQSLTNGEVDTQSLTVNGQVFTFATTGGSSYNGAQGTGVIQLNGLGTAASVARDIAAYFNNNSSVGVFGSLNGTTVEVFAREFGAAGNSINTAVGTTQMTSNQALLANGGDNVMTASAYFDEANGEYELQIQMNHQGEANQVQVFTLSTVSSNAAVVGGSLSGVSFSGAGAVLPTQGTTIAGVMADFAAADETTEWINAEEGWGRTSWDGNNILTQSAAQSALAAMDRAITKKDGSRAELGAFQNRLENTITNLQIQAENLQAAESRISDVDVASEMTTFTKNNILSQAAVAMLAQANSLPQLALSLLG